MGKVFDSIDAGLARWVSEQKMFFVATAPLGADGLVNCSPKGLDTLRITSPAELVWLDLGGSGIETVAHLKENGRIVIMLCAFEGKPRIVRFHGRGEVIERGHEHFAPLLGQFAPQPVCRAVVRVQVTRISDSCGWGVPLYDFRRQRDEIARAVAGLTREQLLAQARRNRNSIDGLAGLDVAALERTLTDSD